MAVYRFPVLIWEDFEGYFTARPVEYHSVSTATGPTPDEVMFQVKEYLKWSYDKYPWQPAPDFLDARLIHYKVAVRPEYRLENRIYPTEGAVNLRVACVYGRQEGGLLVCSLPIFDIRFYYYESKALKDLVTAYVQETLKGLTPQQLSRFLPPKNVSLEEIVLQLPQKEKRYRYIPDLSTLSLVAEPLGERRLRRQYTQAWEREREVADLAQRLNREKANVIIVGETGTGKTTLLANAVRNIERQIKQTEEDEDEQYPYRFWLTSGGRLIAGMQYLGQWQERCERVIEELSGISGARSGTTLCAGNLLDLILAGSREPRASIAAFLLPYLERGELQLVAEATPGELDACRRLLPGFVEMFQVLKLEEFDHAKAITILDRAVESLERNHRVEVSESVGELVYRLFRRFVPYQAFPGRTIAFLNQLFERAALERASEVTAQNAIEQFIRQTGLPELFLRDDMLLGQSEVIETFSKEVIGQSEACRAAANIVTTFKAGLNDPDRPVGVLLFCGPTGVGKTQLARSISNYFFGHGDERDRLIRLDMSEYTGPGAAERLITGPEGLPSDLIKRVRQQPFVVVLLDEIEKAYREVFDVLLSVLDEGRLTDRYGRTTTFKSAVIIMTSNLGADKMRPLGFDKSAAQSHSAKGRGAGSGFKSFFRPEFYNRIDSIVSFKPLDEEMILAITRKELSEIPEREGLSQAGMDFTWTDALLAHLAKQGFDARYGARPLQRAMESLVVAPLARYLLEHPGLKGACVQADLDEEKRVVFMMRDA
ncbi:MAG: AAA family ATPase [Blastocatellia bacterium]|nr:AAA family ATPase [Blastocatellia bacterium]